MLCKCSGNVLIGYKVFCSDFFGFHWKSRCARLLYIYHKFVRHMVTSILIERNIISDALSAATGKHGFWEYMLFNIVFTSVIDSYLTAVITHAWSA